MKRATDFKRSLVINNGLSIHALVKRATMFDFDFDFGFDLSIHALVKRATDSGKGFFKLHLSFNPRPREEGDCIQDISV